jgi:hypothetical protein
VLKSKFLDLCHRPPIKNSFKTKYKSCVKNIKKLIILKFKVIINNINSNKYLSNNENIDYF